MVRRRWPNSICICARRLSPGRYIWRPQCKQPARVEYQASLTTSQNPMGSSSGSAVGVSAGYAPISIGTETDGSLVLPANRAALYTLKPTIPIISREGIVPISSFCDSAGPMTKSVEDLAVLMDVLVDRSKTSVPAGGYISAVTAKWEGLKIGTLDPGVWTMSEVVRQREPGAEEQMVSAGIPAITKLC